MDIGAIIPANSPVTPCEEAILSPWFEMKQQKSQRKLETTEKWRRIAKQVGMQATFSSLAILERPFISPCLSFVNQVYVRKIVKSSLFRETAGNSILERQQVDFA
jgi:hypothetical protein